MSMNKILEHRKYFFFALILIVFISFTISYAITNIAMFLCIGFFLLDHKSNLKKKYHKIKSHKLTLIYISFFVIQIVGYLYSENSKEALRRIEVMLPLLFLPPILFSEKLSSTLYKSLLKIIKIVIPLTFLILLIYHVYIDHKIFNTFVHFTIEEKLGVSQFYLAFILMIPILDALKNIRLKVELWFNIIVGLVSLGFLVLLGNKTTLLFLGLLGISEIIILFKTSTKKAFGAVLIALLLGGGISQVPIVKNRFDVIIKTTDFDYNTIKTKNKYTQTKNTLEHRLYIDYISLELLKHNWLFGYGTGDVQDKLNVAYNENKFKVAFLGNYNPHNQYLNEFLKTGVFGGVLFVILILFLLKQPKNTIGFKLVLFFSLACFIESYLVRQHGVVILAFMIPFFIKNERE